MMKNMFFPHEICAIGVNFVEHQHFLKQIFELGNSIPMDDVTLP